MKAVYVEWIDSCLPNESVWQTVSYVEELKDAEFIINEIGFIYHESKKYLMIVGGHSKENEGYETIYHRVLKIPKACIIKRIDLTNHISGDQRMGKI